MSARGRLKAERLPLAAKSHDILNKKICLSPCNLQLTTFGEKPRVEALPQLRESLDKVLFQPSSLHLLQDPRSGVYNFDSSLQHIRTPPPPLPSASTNGYKPPYRDQQLRKAGLEAGARYVSSTSSMTSILSQCHYLFSNSRPLNLLNCHISRHFQGGITLPTIGARLPAWFNLRKLQGDGICSIDSDPSLSRDTLLSALGHTMEEFLTRRRGCYEDLNRRELPEQKTAGAFQQNIDNNKNNVYRYSNIADFVIRSQLDCYDSRLPFGDGVFDIKSRAVCAVRHDLWHFDQQGNYTGYGAEQVIGKWRSLEREYFDLIRSTLLKYSLQARMGQMDGVFVAYHNVNQMFGFQYLSLQNMDSIIHSFGDRGFTNALNFRREKIINSLGLDKYIVSYEPDQELIASKIADAEFKMSVMLLQHLLNLIRNKMSSEGFAWERIKIAIKAVKLHNAPTKLVVVALPEPILSEVNEDLLSLRHASTSKEISKQLKLIKNHISKTSNQYKKRLVGFEVEVNHSMNFIKSRLPHDESGIFDQSHIHGRDWYTQHKHWRHPAFFDPKDIDRWKINCDFTEITNSDHLVQIYKHLADEQLDLVRKDCQVNENSLDERVSLEKNDIEKEKQNLYFESLFNKKKSKEGNNSFDDFKIQLRAYSKRIVTYADPLRRL